MSTFLLSYSIMFQVLRIRNSIIHVPSVARIHLRKTVTGKPILIITPHTGWSQEIKYGWTMWEEAVRDYQSIQRCLTGCQEALRSVPWMEPVSQTKEQLPQSSTSLSPLSLSHIPPLM